MRTMVHALIVALLLAAGATPAAAAKEKLPGPIPARVVEVLDGDTVRVDANTWLGTTQRVAVRLAGIDAPELDGKCDDERARAIEARAFLAGLVAGGELELRAVTHDKYAGRAVAVVLVGGRALAPQILAARDDQGRPLARRYNGRARAGWCAAGTAPARGPRVRAAVPAGLTPP